MKIIRIKSCKECPYQILLITLDRWCQKSQIKVGHDNMFEENIPNKCPLEDTDKVGYKK